MDSINLGAMLTFVFVTTYTPGPNNITSSSMGILYGYKKTLHYMGGIAVGFFGIMLLAGLVSGTLYAVFPSLEAVMRVVGAGYILWLAYKTLKSSYQFSEDDSPALGFTNGVLLQAVNPKLWVYALTLYSTFLASITDNVFFLLISALFVTMVAFSACSTWAIFGAAIKRVLHRPRFREALNIALALLLVYTAFELAHLL